MFFKSKKELDNYYSILVEKSKYIIEKKQNESIVDSDYLEFEDAFRTIASQALIDTPLYRAIPKITSHFTNSITLLSQFANHTREQIFETIEKTFDENGDIKSEN